MEEKKILFKSDTDKKIAGVCGGLAEYLGIDPVAARVLTFVLEIVTGGLVLVLYIIGAVVLPHEFDVYPERRPDFEDYQEDDQDSYEE